MYRAKHFIGVWFVILGAIATTAIAQVPRVDTGTYTRVSVSSSGEQSNMHSYSATISADGRYVAFASAASNLVPNDTNVCLDIFVHDRWTRQTTRVSVSSSGGQGDRDSGRRPVISADGRYVLFRSGSHLDASSPLSGLYIHDRTTRETKLVDRGGGGQVMSPYGRYVAYCTVSHIYLLDRQTGETECVSVSSSGEPGNRESFHPSISADGRYVTFGSYATNLTPTDVNNHAVDIFLHDRETGQTKCLSVTPSGGVANADSNSPFITPDGRYIAFCTAATNLAPEGNSGIYVYDAQIGQNIYVPLRPATYNFFLSWAGRYVIVSEQRFHIYDRQTGTTTQVPSFGGGYSRYSYQAYQNPFASADGRYVAFFSEATDLVPGDTNGWQDVFVYDRWPNNPTPTAYPTATAIPMLGDRAYLPVLMKQS